MSRSNPDQDNSRVDVESVFGTLEETSRILGETPTIEELKELIRSNVDLAFSLNGVCTVIDRTGRLDEILREELVQEADRQRAVINFVHPEPAESETAQL